MAVLILVGVGALLMSLGFIADVRGFWKDASFSPSFLSSLTSACFGIPLALVVLRYLIEQQEERSARRAAQRLAVATARRMDDLADLLIRDKAALEEARSQIFVVFLWRDNFDPFPGARQSRIGAFIPGTRSYRRRTRLLRKFDEPTRSNLLRAYESLERAIVPHPERFQILQEMGFTWRYLDETVRPKFLESGLSWLDPETVAELRRVSWDPFEDDGRWPGQKMVHIKGDSAHILLSSSMELRPGVFRKAMLDLADTLISYNAALEQIQKLVSEISDQLGTDSPDGREPQAQLATLERYRDWDAARTVPLGGRPAPSSAAPHTNSVREPSKAARLVAAGSWTSEDSEAFSKLRHLPRNDAMRH